jgi:hypothetical protein
MPDISKNNFCFGKNNWRFGGCSFEIPPSSTAIWHNGCNQMTAAAAGSAADSSDTSEDSKKTKSESEIELFKSRIRNYLHN